MNQIKKYLMWLSCVYSLYVKVFTQKTFSKQDMSDWLKPPIHWTGDHKSILLSPDNTIGPIPDQTLDQIIQKSTIFPIEFPIETVRVHQLKEKTSKENLEKNINSTYPLIHEYGLYLCSIFLIYQRKFGPKKDFYKNLSLIGLIDRLLRKRAVMFLEVEDNYMLLDGTTGMGGWESIGTEKETEPLILRDYLSYDEIKLSALLSVSSHTYFLNDGDRYNVGRFEKNRNKVEESGIIIGLIGTRLEKPKVMEYREIMITSEQNNKKYGYGEETSLQNEFLKFYGSSCGTYENMEGKMKADKSRYIDLGRNCYFDTVMYERRIAISIDTLLIEANDRAKIEKKKAYIHVIGLGLGVWKIYQQQNKFFMDTFAQRIELLSETLSDVSDVRFAYIRETTAGKYKHGDRINGIRLHMGNRNPQEKLLDGDHGKLLVVSYAWDGNALPGNEFWGGSLSGSGDPAAACSTQVAELHNAHINDKASGKNLRVATFPGLVTFQEYQQLHGND